MSVIRWREITDRRPERARGSLLSEIISAAGQANEVSFEQISSEELPAALARASAEEVRLCRFSGLLPEAVPGCFENIPSLMLSLKSADALCLDELNQRFWPRNFLYEGFSRFIVSEPKSLDLFGTALINGATAEARAAVAALAKTGFSRFVVSDIDEERGLAYVDDFRRTYFNIQFQFVHRSMIPQLPGVHSFVVNTIDSGQDETQMSEFFYFNFLKSGGFWVELKPGSSDGSLLQEARSVGAQVIPFQHVISYWDAAWAEACFNVRINIASYGDELARRLEMSHSSSSEQALG